MAELAWAALASWRLRWSPRPARRAARRPRATAATSRSPRRNASTSTSTPSVPAHFHKTVDTNGTVDFDQDQSTSVISPITGPVTRLLVSLGEKVKKDTPLASVASSDFAAAISAYRKAIATADTARRIADLDKDLARPSQRVAARGRAGGDRCGERRGRPRRRPAGAQCAGRRSRDHQGGAAGPPGFADRRHDPRRPSPAPWWKSSSRPASCCRRAPPPVSRSPIFRGSG